MKMLYGNKACFKSLSRRDVIDVVVVACNARRALRTNLCIVCDVRVFLVVKM